MKSITLTAALFGALAVAAPPLRTGPGAVVPCGGRPGCGPPGASKSGMPSMKEAEQFLEEAVKASKEVVKHTDFDQANHGLGPVLGEQAVKVLAPMVLATVAWYVANVARQKKEPIGVAIEIVGSKKKEEEGENKSTLEERREIPGGDIVSTDDEITAEYMRRILAGMNKGDAHLHNFKKPPVEQEVPELVSQIMNDMERRLGEHLERIRLLNEVEEEKAKEQEGGDAVKEDDEE